MIALRRFKMSPPTQFLMPRSLIYGFIFGLIAPIFGLFFGLQVSVVIGNILTFPLIILSQITGTPFGMMSTPLRIIGWLLSAIVWAAIFYAVARILQQVRR